MHNLISRVTDSASRDRFNANLFEQTLSAHIYNRWVPAIEFDVLSGGDTSWSPPSSGKFPSWLMNATDHTTAMDAVGALIPKDREWRSGIVTVIPHILLAGTTGNIVLAAKINPLKNGDAASSWLTYNSSYKKTIVAMTPADRLRILDRSEYLDDNKWTCAVDDATVALQIGFGRDCTDAADTMDANVYFLGLTIKYIEGEKSIGELYDPIGR